MDYACSVAGSRIRRPIPPFDCPIAGLVSVLSRFAAELLLKNWRLAESITLVTVYDGNADVVELIQGRKLLYTVDMQTYTCTCMFNQFYSLPCRHVIRSFISAKLPLRMSCVSLCNEDLVSGRLVENSRWLDSRLGGNEPEEIAFQSVQTPPRELSDEAKVMREAREMRHLFTEEQFKFMLERMTAVMHACLLIISFLGNDAIRNH
jgi:hypothetical protein